MTPQFDLQLLKSVGTDVFISANVEIRRPHLVSIGSHVAIDSGFYCTVAAALGDYIHIAPYVTVIGGARGLLSMGNFTTIAAGSRIVCGTDEHLGAGFVGPTIPDQYRDNVIIAPVTFENFASVGTNVVVMPGVTLGEGSVVGACSFVRQSTEPWTIYAGIPAKPLKIRARQKMLAAAREMGYT
ncbi:MAG TPA: acyltransferase [Aggregatilineales bacterium]|nr:acyltransferase [Aggregatilineales bacterium]